MSICPSVRSNQDTERKELRTSNFAKSLLLAIGRSVLWAMSVHRIWYLPYKPPIRNKFDNWTSIPTLNDTKKNYPDRSTGFGTSHISQIGILGS